MKSIFLLVSFCAAASILCAQDTSIEKAIRDLEQQEVKAVLAKDTAVLRRLWDTDFVVNSPDNKVVQAKQNSVDRPVLHNQRSSFSREVEKIIINEGVVFSMGKEIVVAIDDATKTEKTIERRYTNIWMKKQGSWKLVARHANRICP